MKLMSLNLAFVLALFAHPVMAQARTEKAKQPNTRKTVIVTVKSDQRESRTHFIQWTLSAIEKGVDLSEFASEFSEVERRFYNGKIDQKGRELEHARILGRIGGGCLGAGAGAAIGTASTRSATGARIGGTLGFAFGAYGGKQTAEWLVVRVHASGTTVSETVQSTREAVSQTFQTAGKTLSGGVTAAGAVVSENTQAATMSILETAQGAEKAISGTAQSAWSNTVETWNWIRGR